MAAPAAAALTAEVPVGQETRLALLRRKAAMEVLAAHHRDITLAVAAAAHQRQAQMEIPLLAQEMVAQEPHQQFRVRL